MSLPSNNQVRHLYVVKTLKDANGTPADLGDLALCYDTNKTTAYAKYVGQGGAVSSDKVAVGNILGVQHTTAAELNDKIKTHVVTVKDVSEGQVYEIVLHFRHYIGIGELDTTERIGTYRAKKNDTAALIAAGLAKSLQESLGLDSATNASSIDHYKENLATVTVSGNAITIKEVEQYWQLGKFAVQNVPIDVQLGGIFVDDYESYEWATVVSTANITLSNGIKKLADLEYYCMGNRGDIYRGMGYPYNFDTKYMIDMSATYDVFDIHYAYVGDGVSVQKSEKTLTFLVPTASASTFKTQLNTLLANTNVVITERSTGE